MSDVLDRSRFDVDDLDAPPVATLPLSLSARTGRWRTATRLARREMRRRPWRTALSVLLIALPVAGLVVGDIALRTDELPDDLSWDFGRAAALAQLYPGIGVTEAQVEAIIPGGASVGWSSSAYVPLRSADRPDELVDTQVVVRDTFDPIFEGLVRVDHGRLPEADGEVFLDRRLASAFDVGIGDQLSLVRPAQIFTVVGTGRSAARNGDRTPVFLAPGFDLSVLRSDVISRTVFWSTPELLAAFERGEFAVDVPSIPIEVVVDERIGESYEEFFSFWYRQPSTEEADPTALFLGWLFGVLLMGVMGVIVAAAFAVSGRRQLVTIGQLSATGADQTVLRRFLALQGTWTGLVGAAVGVVVGVGVAQAFDEWMGAQGRLAFRPFDWAIIAVTAMVVATVAALLPTRSMASMSVHAAIGGRRPVPPVRRRQLPIGIALVAFGLFLLVVATAAASGGNDAPESLAAAALAGMSILAGVCFLCPLVVDQVARLGARRRGVTMLATRSLGRHRARAAALLAGIVAVGAAATAIAASVEQAVADERDAPWIGWDEDVMMFVGYGLPDADGGQTVVDPRDVRPDLESFVERLVGPVTWTEASKVGVAEGFRSVLVADDALLASMEVPSSLRERLSNVDVFTFQPTADEYSYMATASPSGDTLELPTPTTIEIDDLAFGYGDVFVSPDYADEQGFERQAPIVIGRARVDLSSDLSDSLYRELGYNPEVGAFLEFGPAVPAQLEIRTDVSDGSEEYLGWIRLAAIMATLLLMALIVTLGMALWAAEGRDERDTLVAIGASPSVLARMAGTKAWLLAMVGSVLAVPLGFGTLRLVVGAANQRTTFPWIFAGSAIVILPLVIGGGAWAASAIGQRVRRVTASTAAVD